MESGVETGDLGDLRMMFMEQAHQLEAGRQMLWIVGAEAVQLVNKFAGKPLRGGEFWPAVDDAVADANDGIKAEVFFEPADDELTAGAVIGRFDGQFLGSAIFVFDCDGRIRKTDAFDFGGDEAVH